MTAPRSKSTSTPPTEVASLIRYREQQAKEIPTAKGVYALCDLDNVPIYVGQSTDGIRTRVQRHITSARSDIIANRQVDVWEIGWIRCWADADPSHLTPLENHLFHEFNPISTLMNGTIPPKPPSQPNFVVHDPVMVRILPEDEIVIRKRVQLRLPRQAAHFASLLDHYLIVKDSKELHLALKAHFGRLCRYFNDLRPDLAANAESETE